eukprot:Phypoly_transcript_08021.p1 GENE.Phypoly_transcript_08021~~Phypoly_transcript_08021.p1  ORF type:complete len:386 (+),score=-10.36 Phypoly_transcript_08021:296-1453(+)
MNTEGVHLTLLQLLRLTPVSVTLFSYLCPSYFYGVDSTLTAISLHTYFLPEAMLTCQRTLHGFTDSEIASFNSEQMDSFLLYLFLRYACFVPFSYYAYTSISRNTPSHTVGAHIQHFLLGFRGAVEARSDPVSYLYDLSHFYLVYPPHMYPFFRLARRFEVEAEQDRVVKIWLNRDQFRGMTPFYAPTHSCPVFPSTLPYQHYSRQAEYRIASHPLFRKWLSDWVAFICGVTYGKSKVVRVLYLDLVDLLREHGMFSPDWLLGMTLDQQLERLSMGQLDLLEVVRQRLSLSETFRVSEVYIGRSKHTFGWTMPAHTLTPFNSYLMHPRLTQRGKSLLQGWGLPSEGNNEEQILLRWNLQNPAHQLCGCLTFWEEKYQIKAIQCYK